MYTEEVDLRASRFSEICRHFTELIEKPEIKKNIKAALKMKIAREKGLQLKDAHFGILYHMLSPEGFEYYGEFLPFLHFQDRFLKPVQYTFNIEDNSVCIVLDPLAEYYGFQSFGDYLNANPKIRDTFLDEVSSGVTRIRTTM